MFYKIINEDTYISRKPPKAQNALKNRDVGKAEVINTFLFFASVFNIKDRPTDCLLL